MADKDTDKPEGNEPEGGNDGTDWKAEAEKWKALSRKHEGQAKTNAAELEQLRAAGDESKSELERLAERVAASERRAEEAELKALRADVAASKGLTPAQAKRLHGSTLEELEEDADELLAAFKPATGDEGDGDGDDKDGDRPSGRPQERLRGGSSNSDAEPEETDPAKIAAQIPRG